MARRREARPPPEARLRILGDDNLRDIDLKRPALDPENQRAGGKVPDRTVAEFAQRPTGEKDEKFGGIRQRDVAIGKSLEINPRNMIDENRQKGEAAPKIDFVWCAHVPVRKRLPPLSLSEIRNFRASSITNLSARQTFEERAQHRRQAFRDVFGDKPGPELPRGGAMQPDGGGGSLENAASIARKAPQSCRKEHRPSRRWRAMAASCRRSSRALAGPRPPCRGLSAARRRR